jgi:hypothetical protein
LHVWPAHVPLQQRSLAGKQELPVATHGTQTWEFGSHTRPVQQSPERTQQSPAWLHAPPLPPLLLVLLLLLLLEEVPEDASPSEPESLALPPSAE